MRLWSAILCLATASCLWVSAQGPGAGASVAFRNDTKSAVIVQGISSVGGMIRRGQPVLVAPGRVAGDFNIPSGARFYSVYDANQPSKVLAKDVPVNVPAAGSLNFALRALPNQQVALIPEPTRP